MKKLLKKIVAICSLLAVALTVCNVKVNAEDIKKTLSSFLETYNYADDMNTWFGKVKAIAESLGFASDMKAYKASPEAYKGNVADISAFIRVAVTGKQNAPDLYTVMHILGREKSLARIKAMIDSLK